MTVTMAGFRRNLSSGARLLVLLGLLAVAKRLGQHLARAYRRCEVAQPRQHALQRAGPYFCSNAVHRRVSVPEMPCRLMRRMGMYHTTGAPPAVRPCDPQTLCGRTWNCAV